ncbi:MAG: NAD-dependent epimerase/dehydratase family protein [Rhodococcus sp.]|nr:NAD-dependent epimerase/dehydratase family protein [Rhodococcus sp. (in: high G+C Gram-positive bacteria)]
MKVLVTGASGFLGGRLARRLVDDGHDVSVLIRRSSNLHDLGDLSRLHLVYGDLTDKDSLEAATHGIDVVFHSAARVDERGVRAQFVAENVDATTHLLASARRNGVGRFVFVSSPSALMEYDGGDQIDIDESVPYPQRYLNFYSETKALAEQAVLAADEPGFVTCALRPRAIWGPGDRSGPIVRLLGRAHAGALPDLSNDREVLASFCHVDNIVDAAVKAAESDNVGGKAYFVADDEVTDIWPFMADTARKFGIAPPTRKPNPRVVSAAVSVIETVWKIPYLAKRYSPPLSRYVVALLTRSSTFDTGAARRDFGYSPVVDRDTGLAEFKTWVDAQGGVPELTRHLK